MKNEKTIFEVLFEKGICFAVNVSLNTLKNNSFKKLHETTKQPLTIPVVSGNYYWVKLMTDDKYEPAMAVNLLGVMNFKFFNGVAVPYDKVNDYSECNYC